MPYGRVWHSVIETPTYMAQAKRAGLTEDELVEIALFIAADPEAGAIMAGAGGARKLRHAGRGHGKSGGWRTIHYFGGQDVPVFLLAIYGKGEKGSLPKAERNDLAAVLPLLVSTYRPPLKRKGDQP